VYIEDVDRLMTNSRVAEWSPARCRSYAKQLTDIVKRFKVGNDRDHFLSLADFIQELNYLGDGETKAVHADAFVLDPPADGKDYSEDEIVAKVTQCFGTDLWWKWESKYFECRDRSITVTTAKHDRRWEYVIRLDYAGYSVTSLPRSSHKAAMADAMFRYLIDTEQLRPAVIKADWKKLKGVLS
jgi:hypothetical protein